MSLILTVKRVNALPAQVQASTLYVVKSAQNNFVDLFFTNNDGTEIRHVLNYDDVIQIVNNTAVTSIQWSAIQNGPLSSALDIDQAVLDTHHHSNKVQLDAVSEDGNQNFTFRGSYPRVPLELCEW
jgi:hypothetical protein